MRKIIRALFTIILLLIGASTIVYNLYIRKDENIRELYKEVFHIVQKEKQIETDVYTEFLKNYKYQGEDYFYSIIELDGYSYPILLLSDGVYSFDNDQGVTMCADVYYPIKNEVTLFGSICSNGTAYPLSADATGIYTAGGHEVAKYNLDIQNQTLKLLNKYIMFFHKVGEKVNAISVGIIDGENKIITEEEFNKAYKESENAKVIYFKRLSFQ